MAKKNEFIFNIGFNRENPDRSEGGRDTEPAGTWEGGVSGEGGAGV
ncbi:MAG: hypothetical protein ACLSHX_17860 [Suilimivivens sp.]